MLTNFYITNESLAGIISKYKVPIIKKALFLCILMSLNIYSFSQAPTITSFSPSFGAVGTVVTIKGTNLKGLINFKIGDTTTILISNTDTTATGMVMPGAVTGTIKLTNGGVPIQSSQKFQITATPYPIVQKGNKLAATSTPGGRQGFCVAISADGTTALVGSQPVDGFVYVYTMVGGIWTLQSKLPGVGESVALSADGNTAIFGSPNVNGGVGFVSRYKRVKGIWSSNGGFAPNQYILPSRFGYSVAISADAGIIVIGGPNYNHDQGAIWVVTNNNNMLGPITIPNPNNYNPMSLFGFAVGISADGNTIIASAPYYRDKGSAFLISNSRIGSWANWAELQTGAPVGSKVGTAVAISANGTTAAVGAMFDNNGAGGVSIFNVIKGGYIRFDQQLLGTNSQGHQGSSASLSADGNTVVFGGIDGGNWVFTRSGGSWSQRAKLVESDGIGWTQQGMSVAISANGNSLISGGQGDNSYAGAAWIFNARSLNSSLSNLTINTGTVTPTFTSEVTSYTTTVSNTTTSIIVTPTVTDPTATLKVNGTAAISGQPFTVNNLNVGTNTVTILVTAEDKITTSTYTLSVSRAAPVVATITRFTPTVGGPGTSVTITGTNLNGATAVNFGGVPATSFTVVDNNTITAVVDHGSSGSVSVSTLAAGSPSLAGFTYNITLPLTFLNLTGNRTSHSIHLKWNVQQAGDCLQYDIERSSDGRIFTTIGTTKATTSDLYEFMDEQPLSTATYYRIKAVSRSQINTLYSSVLKIGIDPQEQSITVFPNPVNNKELSLAINGQLFGTYHIELVNMTGEVVYQNTVDKNSTGFTLKIALSKALSAGTYTLKITDPNKITTSKQVIMAN